MFDVWRLTKEKIFCQFILIYEIMNVKTKKRTKIIAKNFSAVILCVSTVYLSQITFSAVQCCKCFVIDIDFLACVVIDNEFLGSLTRHTPLGQTFLVTVYRFIDQWCLVSSQVTVSSFTVNWFTVKEKTVTWDLGMRRGIIDHSGYTGHQKCLPHRDSVRNGGFESQSLRCNFWQAYHF